MLDFVLFDPPRLTTITRNTFVSVPLLLTTMMQYEWMKYQQSAALGFVAYLRRVDRLEPIVEEEETKTWQSDVAVASVLMSGRGVDIGNVITNLSGDSYGSLRTI